MFDEAKALELLTNDRKEYLKDFIKGVQGLMNIGRDDLASHAVITAAESLSRLDGGIQYVKQLQNFKQDEYPRFAQIFQ